MAAILILREFNQSGSKSVEQIYSLIDSRPKRLNMTCTFFSNLMGVLDFNLILKIFKSLKLYFKTVLAY